MPDSNFNPLNIIWTILDDQFKPEDGQNYLFLTIRTDSEGDPLYSVYSAYCLIDEEDITYFCKGTKQDVRLHKSLDDIDYYFKIPNWI